jgi:hypothetical protein
MGDETVINSETDKPLRHSNDNESLYALAKELYFKKVKVENYRDNFLSELTKRNVIDKRSDGFHCCYCDKFLTKEIAFVGMDEVIFPKKNESELWIVNSHYDGCRGWD